jgi:NAD(P)-dependent dehydrogenase (short-subunit alcohol dehydrogenase family)
MINLFSLKGKVALVSGATGYLGSSIVEGIASAGALVYVNGRSHQKVSELIEYLKSKKLNARAAVFDITDYDQVRDFFENFRDKKIDILINNAYSGSTGSSITSSMDDFRESYEVSIVAAHNLFQLTLPYLRVASQNNGSASVINIASMYGSVSPDFRIYGNSTKQNPPFYGAAKAALIQWTRYLSCEFAKEGLRINSISPGPFPSSVVKKEDVLLYQKIKEKTPLGRAGLPEELIGPVIFLSSDASSFVTGINLSVDGGWTAL